MMAATENIIDKMREALIATNETAHDAVEYRAALKSGLRKTYILAGKACTTILNPVTGKRFTYEIKKAKEGKNFFVRLLNGPSNESNFIYIGYINSKQEFLWTEKSKVSKDAMSFRAFEWLSKNWESGKVEVWTEGRCGRCGRKLTVPESRERGLGPECAGL